MEPYRYVGIRDFLDRACAAGGRSTFLHFRGREWSYADLAAITEGAAAEWARLGLEPGSRVAMLLPTGPDHVFAWLSVVRLGAIAAPIHPESTAVEAAAALALLESDAVVCDAALADRLSLAGDLLRRVPIRIRAGTAPADALAPTGALEDLLASRGSLRGAPAPGPEDVAEILMTSGTTGKPKAAMQTHRTSVITGEAFAHWLGLGAGDRLFTCLPLSHINARSYSTMGAIAAGASLALEERFSASQFWRWAVETAATEANAIGAMIHILLKQAPSPEERAHRLRVVYCAPALPAEAHVEFERRFGVRLVAGYGLTESTFGFIQPLSEDRSVETMGKPRRHPHPGVPAEVRLVADGLDVSGSEPGEVWLRSPACFAGYFRDEAQTRATLVDGWVKTGDLARREPDGSYTFLGRIKHIIRRRGENVSPAEVEAAIEEHPGVAEAAVVGVPSPLGEEEIRAYVVRKAGSTVGPDELQRFCGDRLAAFKVPSEWRFPEALPRTHTERIAYHLLPKD
jgi:crotonobetaine/carnitine-CoA ligase